MVRETKTTRLAIAGCGRAAEWLYVPALKSARGVRLVAAVDPIAQRHELIASQFDGCIATHSLEAMLDQVQVDAMIVASPPAQHLPMLRTLVSAGLPALVEKPLAPSMQGLDEIAALVRQGEICIAVGYNRRFRDPVAKLRQVVQSRLPEQPVHVRYVMTSDAVTWSPITGVIDPLEDLGSHQLDLLRFVFNREILTIAAERPNKLTCDLHVTMSGGITAHCTCQQTDRAREDMTIDCGGRHYKLNIGSERIAPAAGPLRQALDLADGVKRKLTRSRSSFKASYTRQLEAFVAQVRGGEASDALATFDDGVAVIQAVDAARGAADRRNQEIHLT